ncbi:MAG: UDP-glucose-undecaprenyl-phosphate glucosyltransferase, partial [Candidatus Roizmanbacteria bacterium GW2011_GWA2_35_8]
MQLSIIVPCYNEEKRIIKSLKIIASYIKREKKQTEVVFINDGSTDKTSILLSDYKKSLEKNLLFKIKIINYVKNKGKGYAIKKGFIKSSGKFLLICDADLSTPLTELTKLFRYTNDFDLIIGSRKQKDAKIIKRQSFIRTTLGKSYSWISKILLNVNVNDFTCGFKLIKRGPALRIASKMLIDRWAYDSELLKIATIHNYKIKEIGVRWKNNP